MDKVDEVLCFLIVQKQQHTDGYSALEALILSLPKKDQL
jgi:hypothetical protein